jgi:hypothetical protein
LDKRRLELEARVLDLFSVEVTGYRDRVSPEKDNPGERVGEYEAVPGMKGFFLRAP